MSNKITLKIILPCSVFLSRSVYMVVISGKKGYFGVLKNHYPMTTTIIPGTIHIYDERNETSEKLFIMGGIVHIDESECNILTEKIIYATDLKKRDSEILLAEGKKIFKKQKQN